MIKDKNGEWFVKGKVKENKANKQLKIYIINSAWKFFPVGGRVKVVSNAGIPLTRKVMSCGDRQRAVTIPIGDNDLFNDQDIVKIYPIPQPKVSKSQEKQLINGEQTKQNDKQIQPKNNMS